MTYTVALLGKSGPLLETAKARQDHIDEFWGVGSVGVVWDGPLHRLYEIHHRDFIITEAYSPGYWNYLCAQNVPIYTQEYIPEFYQSREYPLGAVLELCGGRVKRGAAKPVWYFTSSFDFMMAHALVEGVPRIEVYFNPQTETEYRYQREGIAFWCGLAAGMGSEVWFPDESSLMNAQVYGYGAAQMVPRQILETLKTEHENKRRKHINTFNHLQGQKEATTDPEKARELEAKLSAEFGALHRMDAAVQVFEHLINKCDLPEVEFKMLDRFKMVEEL